MRELYEDLKEILLKHQQEVGIRKDRIGKNIKVLTKDSRKYKTLLHRHNEEINRNLRAVERFIQRLKILEEA